MTLYDCILKMLESKETLKKKTLNIYKYITQNYLQFTKTFYIKKLKQNDINKFQQIIASLNNSYSIVKLCTTILNSTFYFAFKKKIIKKIYSISCKLKSYSKPINALQLNEQQKLINYILSNHKTYNYGILISIYTGIRIGELLAITWDKVDLKNKYIIIDKTTSQLTIDKKQITLIDTPKTFSSIRKIPISVSLMPILIELRENSFGNYLISKNGKQIFIRAYQKSFENILKKLKISHYGFHSLRHTFATRAVEKGVDIKTLSELLGHANINTTLSRYVHSSFEQKKIAVDKICK